VFLCFIADSLSYQYFLFKIFKEARAYCTHFVSMKTSSCLTIFTDRPADSEVYSVMSCIHVHNHGNTHLHGPNIVELFCWMFSLSIIRESFGSELLKHLLWPTKTCVERTKKKFQIKYTIIKRFQSYIFFIQNICVGNVLPFQYRFRPLRTPASTKP